jgi:hypothetical protein
MKRCMLQTNDLAQKLRNLANEHNVEEISLYINCDSREHVDLGMISSPSSSASTTPVKSPQPTQPTERASKVTKINFD